MLALGDIAARVAANGLASRVLVDLGELRGRTYYTGGFFQVFAEGVGAPIAAGGRYDQLLARYGVDLPATGAALFLDAVEEALGDESEAPSAVERVVLVGPSEARAAAAARLRAAGAEVIERDDAGDDELRAFAAAQRASRVERCAG